MIPQIIYILMFLLGTFTIALKHGEVAEKTSVLSSFIGTTIVFLLYAWGGFFSSFGIPQFMICAYYMWHLALDMIVGYRVQIYSIWKSLLVSILIIGCLFWGGFFNPLFN